MQVELLHLKTPPNLAIADSLKSVDSVRSHLNQQQWVSKFKGVQTKVYQVQQWLLGSCFYLPVKYGGQHTSKVTLSLVSALLNFEFLAVAPPPRPKPVVQPTVGGGKKRRVVIHSNSDEDESEEEEEKKCHYESGLVMQHGLLVKPKLSSNANIDSQGPLSARGLQNARQGTGHRLA